MLSQMASVIASNECFSGWPHLKFTPFFVRSRKGAERVAYPGINWELNPAMPRKKRTSSLDVGGAAPRSAATFSGSGRTPSEEKMYPKNFVRVALKMDFLGLMVRPVRRNISKTPRRARSCSAIASVSVSPQPQTRMLSAMLSAPEIPSRSRRIVSWQMAEDGLAPCISRVQRFSPHGVEGC